MPSFLHLYEGGFAMVPDLFFPQLVLIALVWLCLMLHWTWPSDPPRVRPTPEPTPSVPKRHRERKPFAGLTKKPHCDACAHASNLRPEAPCPRHPASCPHGGAAARWIPPRISAQPRLCLSGLGGLGQSPRQRPSQWRLLAALLCVACHLYFLETLGTIFHASAPPSSSSCGSSRA